MRPRLLVVAVCTSLLAASPLNAQQAPSAGTARNDETPLTNLQTAVACAISPTPLPVDADPLTIVGSQDPSVRSVFGPRDRVVINAGTARHVDVGQRYFTRRAEWFTPRSTKEPYTIRTSGWIRIVAANESMAIGVVDHACADISSGDYLAPFTAPDVPADIDRTVTTGTLDFSHPGRVLYGDLLQWTAAAGSFMLVDRGAGDGATVGTRYAVYRDLRQTGVPLVAIGEAVIVSTGASASVVRITDSRDAIMAGDYVVPRR